MSQETRDALRAVVTGTLSAYGAAYFFGGFVEYMGKPQLVLVPIVAFVFAYLLRPR